MQNEKEETRNREKQIGWKRYMEEIRLNKWLSERGICSRREADRLVAEGRILINGQPALMGQKIREGQIVSLDGKVLQEEMQNTQVPRQVLLMVNKPRGIVCTTSDKDRAQNIVEFVGYPERVYPVGRLDKDSEGLILLTNQGDLVNKMMRSRNAHEKEYQVVVDRPVTEEFLCAMRSGVPVLDTVTRPCQAEKMSEYGFRIVLTQGLNRQIRRMCEYLGYHVTSLKRVRIMNLHLGELKTGEWREVTRKEENELKRLLRNSSSLPYEMEEIPKGDFKKGSKRDFKESPKRDFKESSKRDFRGNPKRSLKRSMEENKNWKE